MRLQKTLSGKKDIKTPIWFMRQAGRYLPEYRELRASEKDFISYCLNSTKAMEATLQPIRRYDLDAAIIFSDILMIPWAMSMGVHFITGEGPKLRALKNIRDIEQYQSDDLEIKLKPVSDAISLTRQQLPEDKSLIGFCGAPWTVATYMLEGGSSRDFIFSRQLLWENADDFMILIDRIINESIRLLTMQANAGADVLMIFDSWAGAIPSNFRNDFVVQPIKRIIEGLRKNNISAPVIGFPKGIGEDILSYAEESQIDGLGLDHGVNLYWADQNLPKNLPVQGNLDPASVISGGKAMFDATDNILKACASRPHIFNLGHGFNPSTPPEHVAQLIDHIKKY